MSENMEQTRLQQGAANRTRLENRIAATTEESFNTLEGQLAEKERTQLREMEQARENREANMAALVKEVLGESEAMQFNPEFRKIADMLGMSLDDIPRNSQELKIIKEWADKRLEGTERKGTLGILEELKSLKTSMGIQEIGETALKKIFRYVRLDVQAKDIQREQELLKE